MQFRFNAEEWAGMTPTQRIQRCTNLAEEANKMADQADGGTQPFYLALADQWLLLATQIDKSVAAAA